MRNTFVFKTATKFGRVFPERKSACYDYIKFINGTLVLIVVHIRLHNLIAILVELRQSTCRFMHENTMHGCNVFDAFNKALTSATDCFMDSFKD